MRTLYDTDRSGHCYRVRLLLGFLGLEYRSVTVAGAERKAPWFLALNPFGEVPTLDDDGVVIPDSCAILVYLAKRYDPSGTWLPADPIGHARVQRWLSVASGELVQGVAAPRSSKRFNRPIDLPRAHAIGKRLFEHLEAHLGSNAFLAADHATIADLALFSYLTVADEAGLDLSPCTAVRAWMSRVEALPGYAPIPRE